MSKLAGVIKTGRIVTVRFSQGGKVAWVKFKKGDRVARGQALAGLDTRPVQIDLDRELAEYRKVRAEFDKLSREIPEAVNDEQKTKKELAQARLEIAVKAVEKRKYELDSLNLVSPVDGIVVEDSSLVAGIWIAPSGFGVEIADLGLVVLELNLPEKDIDKLNAKQGLVVETAGKKILASLSFVAIVADKKGKEPTFKVQLQLLGKEEVVLGRMGTVEL